MNIEKTVQDKPNKNSLIEKFYEAKNKSREERARMNNGNNEWIIKDLQEQVKELSESFNVLLSVLEEEKNSK